MQLVDACNANISVLEAFAKAEGNIAAVQRLQSMFDEREMVDEIGRCCVLEEAFRKQLRKLTQEHSIINMGTTSRFLARLNQDQLDPFFQALSRQVSQGEFRTASRRLSELAESRRGGAALFEERRPESDTEGDSD